MEMTPGYKKTEVGVIPEEWRVSRFGDLCDVYRGGSPRPIQSYITDSPDGVNWIKIGDIGVGAKYIDSTAEKIIAAGVSRSRHVKVGDFLLSNSMSFGRPYILRTDGCIHDGWLVIQGYQRAFDTEYLYYCLSGEAVVAQYIRYAAGSSVLNLNKQLVSGIRVAVPPTAEQRAIAATLADVDALLAKLDQLIAKKRDLKHAAMQQLLFGRSRLPGFTRKWISRPLGSVLSICHGKNQRHVETSDGPIPILATGGQIGTASTWLYDKPSVLIGRKGTINRPQYIDMPFWTVDTLFYSAMKGTHCAKFFYYRFCLIDWSKYNEASGVPSLSARTIEAIEVDCPEPPEQLAIANVLSDMDAELTALEARRDKTRQLKHGMMQALLTGRIRLK